jgi:hypothetical protein
MQGASRLATVGSIFSRFVKKTTLKTLKINYKSNDFRLNGLIESNIVRYVERPTWFDVYKTFPPKRDPVYRTVIGGDEVSSYEPPKILYYEDQIRSLVTNLVESFN